MEAFAAFSCLLSVFCVVLISACPSGDSCRRQAFHGLENVTYPGEVLLRGGPWPLSKCRRFCRQYLECYVFSFEWLSDKYGMCNIYGGFLNSTQIIQEDRVTLYASCPDRFEWAVDAKKCYTTQVYGPVNGTEIFRMCGDIQPGSRPAEPRNGAQMNRTEEIAGNYSVWIAIYRPDNYTDIYDFKYYSDGIALEYQYWHDSYPTSDPDRCVLSAREYGYEWIYIDCYSDRYTICEI